MKNNSSIIKNPIHIAGLYIPNTYNYGSMMMAENFITYLYSMNSGIRLYLDLSTDLDLQRMVESTGRPILRLKEAAELMDNDSRGKGKMAKKIIRLTDVYQRPKDLEKQSISSIVVFGGDSISEYYTSPFETSID